jgi:hypothetical protein
MVEIKSVAVLRFGLVCAVLYAFGGLIEALVVVPIMSLAPAGSANAFPAGMKSLMGAGAFIFLPVLFAIFGFIGSVIMALLYNLVARWTGGIRVRVEQKTSGLELQPLSS